MSEECISVSCPRCGLTLTDIVNDSIRKQLDALQSRIDDLENAWFVDESIQSDGSLRPSLLDTINRTKQEESERDTLQAKLDIAVKTITKIRSQHIPSETARKKCYVCDAILAYDEALAETERQE
jgi:hypothetical protein